MEKEKTKPPADWREARRLQAWKLKKKGWKQKDIAEALSVTPGAVSLWMGRAARDGPEALRRQPRPGAPPRLNEEQLNRLPELLKKGAQHFGFRGDVWTQPRVAKLIERQFGVSYHPSHVGRILKAIEWSRQKPVTRASQRDEAAIERWRTEKWLEIKKKPQMRGEP